MNRRHLLYATTALLPRRTWAAAKPWQASILQGGFDGKSYAAGILLHLSRGWKTYWRVPGAGGVPPEISVTGSNVKSFSFECPMPQRLAGPEGENIGYHDAVCFPLTIEPVDSATPVAAQVNLFAGVCETICIPVQAAFEFAGQPRPQLESAGPELQGWQMKVPQTANVISSARYDASAQSLFLQASREVSDIFIECDGLPQLFNAPPQPAPDGVQVRLQGLSPGQSVAGKSCRFTMATPFGGLEQTLTVG